MWAHLQVLGTRCWAHRNPHSVGELWEHAVGACVNQSAGHGTSDPRGGKEATMDAKTLVPQLPFLILSLHHEHHRHSHLQLDSPCCQRDLSQTEILVWHSLLVKHGGTYPLWPLQSVSCQFDPNFYFHAMTPLFLNMFRLFQVSTLGPYLLPPVPCSQLGPDSFIRRVQLSHPLQPSHLPGRGHCCPWPCPHSCSLSLPPLSGHQEHVSASIRLPSG